MHASRTPFAWAGGRENAESLPWPVPSPPNNHRLGHAHTSPSKLSESHYIDLCTVGPSPKQEPTHCLYSQSQPPLQPFHPSNYLAIAVARRVVKAGEIVRILPSNSFLLLFFYQEQHLHDFIVASQEISLLPYTEAFSWTWLCVPALWAHQWRESISFLCQAVVVPRVDDKWKTVQGPCVSESKDTRRENT